MPSKSSAQTVGEIFLGIDVQVVVPGLADEPTAISDLPWPLGTELVTVAVVTEWCPACPGSVYAYLYDRAMASLNPGTIASRTEVLVLVVEKQRGNVLRAAPDRPIGTAQPGNPPLPPPYTTDFQIDDVITAERDRVASEGSPRLADGAHYGVPVAAPGVGGVRAAWVHQFGQMADAACDVMRSPGRACRDELMGQEVAEAYRTGRLPTSGGSSQWSLAMVDYMRRAYEEEGWAPGQYGYEPGRFLPQFYTFRPRTGEIVAASARCGGGGLFDNIAMVMAELCDNEVVPFRVAAREGWDGIGEPFPQDDRPADQPRDCTTLGCPEDDTLCIEFAANSPAQCMTREQFLNADFGCDVGSVIEVWDIECAPGDGGWPRWRHVEHEDEDNGNGNGDVGEEVPGDPGQDEQPDESEAPPPPPPPPPVDEPKAAGGSSAVPILIAAGFAAAILARKG